MKNQYKSRILVKVVLLMSIACIFSGCKKSQDEVVKESTKPQPTKEAIVVTKAPNLHKGEVRSKLTGLYVKKEIANKRPYAMMFNNIKFASPQSGTSEADILYEAVVEGGITRLMGVFGNVKSDRLGSARSARHYFVSFADEYDAIFVHYGQTKYAVSKIQNLGIDTLSGLSGEGTTVFYRDHSISAPHNAFASTKGIKKATKDKKYRTEYEDGYEGHFKFYNKSTDLTGGTLANKVKINYSNYTSPYFEYDTKNKVYKRFQFGVPHNDRNTGKQLKFKNIILQYVKEWDIDKKGYQTMDIENSSGKGYYITNGKCVEITWDKNENQRKMKYYDKNGKELTINPGKTYIGIVPNDRKDGVVFSDINK